jgi:hypothetical protein
MMVAEILMSSFSNSFSLSLSHLGNELVTTTSTRLFTTLSKDEKVKAPPMVYISGEEMTHYVSQLVVEEWIKPYFDVSAWETYDLSCKSRDDTNDQVLKDAVEAGKRIGAIFKEPTITPSALQVRYYCMITSMTNAISSIYDTVYCWLTKMFFQTNIMFLGQTVWFEQGLWFSQWSHASWMEWHYHFERYHSH